MVRQVHTSGPQQQLRPLQTLLPRRPAVVLRPDEGRAPPGDPGRPQHPSPDQLERPAARDAGTLFVPRPGLRPRSAPGGHSEQLLFVQTDFNLSPHNLPVQTAHHRLIPAVNRQTFYRKLCTLELSLKPYFYSRFHPASQVFTAKQGNAFDQTKEGTLRNCLKIGYQHQSNTLSRNHPIIPSWKKKADCNFSTLALNYVHLGDKVIQQLICSLWKSKCNFAQLPQQYRRFLLTHNFL